MGIFFTNDQGQKVGLCPECDKIKPDYLFQKKKDRVNQFYRCYECHRTYHRNILEEWAEIKRDILIQAGGCVWPGCHMKFPRDLQGNFALDHIDPSLKQHDRETAAHWVKFHKEEFWRRVFPNLQVLCNHHNGEKYAIEYSVGGIMHTNPWDEDIDEDLILDFNQIALVLPGMESFVNPLT